MKCVQTRCKWFCIVGYDYSIICQNFYVEKFIQKYLMTYLNTFELIHQSQSRFRPGNSTETALIHVFMIGHWLKNMNEDKIVEKVMVDVRKAFDLVDHVLLLKKLAIYNCCNAFMRLMESHLDNRTQAVSIKTKTSETGTVTCGVPQGSILCPWLFLVFMYRRKSEYLSIPEK